MKFLFKLQIIQHIYFNIEEWHISRIVSIKISAKIDGKFGFYLVKLYYLKRRMLQLKNYFTGKE